MRGLFEKEFQIGPTCRKKLLSTNYIKFIEVLTHDSKAIMYSQES